MTDTAPAKAHLRGELEWRTWGDDNVVYHVPSCHTHLLDLVAAAGLRCLEEAPATVDELGARMATRLGIEADAAMQSYAAQLVQRFVGVGLVEIRTDG
jgi:PqqD family protein of HPr-rel-A system